MMAAMMTNDRALVDQVSQMDKRVDSLDEAIKLDLTKLTRGSLDDVLRDLRRIHSHICSVAYPVLDAAGELAAYRSAESELPTLPAPVPGR
jgi:Na+/phosphate symporter